MKNKDLISRRSFLKASTAVGLSGYLVPRSTLLLGQEPQDPHYFLMIAVEGGLDHSYGFDARPHAMTAAGIIQNHRLSDSQFSSEPKPWSGSFGDHCLVTPCVAGFERFRSRLAVFNGVQMSVDDDGHDQNISFVHCGVNTPQASFLHKIASVMNNRQSRPNLLNEVFLGHSSNSRLALAYSQGFSIAYPSLQNIIGVLHQQSEGKSESALDRYLIDHADRHSRGRGLFERGALRWKEGLESSKLVSANLRSLQIESSTSEGAAIVQLFKQATSGAIALNIDEDFSRFDTHGTEDAKALPSKLTALVSRVTGVLSELESAALPDGSGRNYLDVTTVLITSEFARTLRQNDKKIEESGSDHNALTNTVIMLGKGIRGGEVVGSSDFATVGEKVSPAHLKREHLQGVANPVPIKSMARPFDFGICRSLTDVLPEEYRREDYLSYANIVNSLFDLFGVPKSEHLKFSQQGKILPTIPKIIS